MDRIWRKLLLICIIITPCIYTVHEHYVYIIYYAYRFGNNYIESYIMSYDFIIYYVLSV